MRNALRTAGEDKKFRLARDPSGIKVSLLYCSVSDDKVQEWTK
jgi:hypothetical protein